MDFKNKFEREFFMTFNLLRTEPTEYISYIKNYMATENHKIHPVASKVVIGKLRELSKGLSPVNFN